MQQFPHHYEVSAHASTESHVELESEASIKISSGAPPQFGGDADLWSPETLLVAAVADCFILSFKAIARISRFEWLDLNCKVTGTLDKADKTLMFTHFEIEAVLQLSDLSNETIAVKLLEKAEKSCLITNSLKATSSLHTRITTI